jgi:hypothetical protein
MRELPSNRRVATFSVPGIRKNAEWHDNCRFSHYGGQPDANLGWANSLVEDCRLFLRGRKLAEE